MLWLPTTAAWHGCVSLLSHTRKGCGACWASDEAPLHMVLCCAEAVPRTDTPSDSIGALGSPSGASGVCSPLEAKQ